MDCKLHHPLFMTSIISLVSFILTVLLWSSIGLKARDSIWPKTKRSFAATVPVLGATPSEVFSSRRQRYQTVCQHTRTLPGQVKSVYVHKKTGVIYCHVPKAGCTFWKRVFNFVNKKSSSIFSTSRYLVHFKNTVEEQYQPSEHSVDRYPIRILVARDPLARILSSYLDKMYLPDFWHTLGQRFARKFHHVRSWTSILRFLGGPLIDHQPSYLIDTVLDKYRRRMQINANHTDRTNKTDFLKSHLKEIYKKFDSVYSRYLNNAKHSSFRLKGLECGKYLSFEEFVSVSISQPEVHWEPTHTMCNPCEFQPTHVSLMSTFNSDAKVILAALGHRHAIDHLNYTAQVDEEIKMIVDYFFDIVYYNEETKIFLENCMTAQELGFRLWQNFVWRGYIHPNVSYAIPDIIRNPSWIKTDLLAQLRFARTLGLKDPSAMISAKLAFYRKAFSSLSQHTLESLVRKFKYDYALFIDP